MHTGKRLAAPSEYIGSNTTQPKGSPASILLATFSASSTGISWLAFPAIQTAFFKTMLDQRGVGRCGQGKGIIRRMHVCFFWGDSMGRQRGGGGGGGGGRRGPRGGKGLRNDHESREHTCVTDVYVNAGKTSLSGIDCSNRFSLLQMLHQQFVLAGLASDNFHMRGFGSQ